MPTFSVELIINNIRLPISRTKDQGANAGDLSRKVQRVCLPRSNVKLGQKERGGSGHDFGRYGVDVGGQEERLSRDTETVRLRGGRLGKQEEHVLGANQFRKSGQGPREKK
jgi:hypothetical protein